MPGSPQPTVTWTNGSKPMRLPSWMCSRKETRSEIPSPAGGHSHPSCELTAPPNSQSYFCDFEIGDLAGKTSKVPPCISPHFIFLAESGLSVVQGTDSQGPAARRVPFHVAALAVVRFEDVQDQGARATEAA
ncbi:hypothetical protein GCM10017710_47450 [Arthrobacter ramosus]